MNKVEQRTKSIPDATVLIILFFWFSSWETNHKYYIMDSYLSSASLCKC